MVWFPVSFSSLYIVKSKLTCRLFGCFLHQRRVDRIMAVLFVSVMSRRREPISSNVSFHLATKLKKNITHKFNYRTHT